MNSSETYKKLTALNSKFKEQSVGQSCQCWKQNFSEILSIYANYN